MEIFIHGNIYSWKYLFMEIFIHENIHSWKYLFMEIFIHGNEFINLHCIFMKRLSDESIACTHTYAPNKPKGLSLDLGFQFLVFGF